MKIKRALLSVSDKTGIEEFAKALAALGVELISTGGTASKLRDIGLMVKDVSEVTRFPECLDGRVKTLHPKIHAGILADRSKASHMSFLEDEGIGAIDMLVVNLYPFKETVSRPGVTIEDASEQIDIGGPTMLRAAAKNHASVTSICDPEDYDTIIKALEETGEIDSDLNLKLAAKVFSHTAAYDALIAKELLRFTDSKNELYPHELTLAYEKAFDLRYGENSHQTAAFYHDPIAAKGSLPQALQLHGKALSYNNISDADAALMMLKEFSTKPTVVAVKHANPCGIASRATILDAWEAAYEADLVSIFGGIVALNRPVTQDVAKQMSEIFLEVVIAPSYDEEAFEILSQKKNIRLLSLEDIDAPLPKDIKTAKTIYGGLLVQEADVAGFDKKTFEQVTKAAPIEALMDDAVFGMKVVKHVKSNGICLVKDQQTVGVGPGQVNRITALEIALRQAGDKAKGAVLASDAFFPFDDCVKLAATYGVALIVQPGGSIGDQASIDACDEAGIPMLFTGRRHFRH